MKVTLHLEGNRQTILDQIAEFKTTLETSLTAQPAKAEARAAKRAAKVEAAEEPEEVKEEETEEEIDLGEEAAEEEEELSLDKDIVPAFQAFVKKSDKNRAKAQALVTKYKVKSVRDIPPAKFKEVMAALR